MKVWDITKPKDAWEEEYAKVEYARTGMNAVGDKKITVLDSDEWRDSEDQHQEFIDHELEEHNIGERDE